MRPDAIWEVDQYTPQGMTLRDWFAAHASEQDIDEHRHWYSRDGSSYTRTREEARYHYADAMIKTREQ